MKDSFFIFACILTVLMSGILYGSLGHMYYKKDKHAHKKEKKIDSKH